MSKSNKSHTEKQTTLCTFELFSMVYAVCINNLFFSCWSLFHWSNLQGSTRKPKMMAEKHFLSSPAPVTSSPQALRVLIPKMKQLDHRVFLWVTAWEEGRCHWWYGKSQRNILWAAGHETPHLPNPGLAQRTREQWKFLPMAHMPQGHQHRRSSDEKEVL